MSRLGMTYDDKVIDNMRAIPADKNFIPKEEQFLNQDLFTQLNSNWKVKANADKNFFEKDYAQKRDALRKLAMQPELEDILDIMANESIVYDSELSYICQPFIDTAIIQMLNEENANRIRNAMDVNFTKLYMLLNWKQDAWNTYKRYQN